MNTRKFALIGGSVMLFMGIFALAPPLSTIPDWLPALKLELSYGLFLNLFPMNIVNKLALISFGIAGIIVSQPKHSVQTSIYYSRTVFFVMGIAALLGLYRPLNTFFGYWPLFGAEIWSHAIFAVLGAYYGFKAKEVDEPARQL